MLRHCRIGRDPFVMRESSYTQYIPPFIFELIKFCDILDVASLTSRFWRCSARTEPSTTSSTLSATGGSMLTAPWSVQRTLLFTIWTHFTRVTYVTCQMSHKFHPGTGLVLHQWRLQRSPRCKLKSVENDTLFKIDPRYSTWIWKIQTSFEFKRRISGEKHFEKIWVR